MIRRLFIVTAFSLLGVSAQPGKIRLIVQGDDLGAARAVNQATIRAYREGVVRSVNVIVPGAWFLDAVRMLGENSDLDVGVHLALTSEWDRIKWRPISIGRSFVDENGYFFPFVFTDRSGMGRKALQDVKFDVAEIERELRAQIDLARKHIPRISYLWPHMGCTSVSPEVREVLAKLVKEYDLPVPGPDYGIQPIRGVWKREMDGEQRAVAFAGKLATLEPGTWHFVEHAAFDTEETRAMGHPGYEDVARDRQAVYDAWTHPKVKEMAAKRGIELIGHRDWRKR